MAYGNINVPGVTGPELEEAIASKVDKVAGKGLSANDFTTAEKNKLADLESPTCFTPTVTRYLPPDESVGYGCLTLSSERFKANYFYLFFLTDSVVVNPAKMPVFHPARCAGGGTVVVYCENFNGGDSSKTPFLRAAGFKLN